MRASRKEGLFPPGFAGREKSLSAAYITWTRNAVNEQTLIPAIRR